MTQQLKEIAERCRKNAYQSDLDRTPQIMLALAVIADALVEQRERRG